MNCRSMRRFRLNSLGFLYEFGFRVALEQLPLAHGAGIGSLAPLKMNFTVPPAPVRFNWHLTGFGSDSVPSLQ